MTNNFGLSTLRNVAYGTQSDGRVAPGIMSANGTYARYTVTPTITAGAYSANDVIGGLLTFDMSAALAGGGILANFRIYDKTTQQAAGTLYLFNSAPTGIADNATFLSALPDADFDKGIATITTGSYTTFGGNYTAFLGTGYNIVVVGSTLYAYFVCSGTPSYSTTSDLKFQIVMVH